MEKDREYKYDVFISYRHLNPDEDIADALHKLLETFKIPKDIAADIDWKHRSFIDEQELTTRDLSDSIVEALKHSKYFISVCSKRTKLSPWCIKEIELFRKLHGDDRVFALLVEGEPSEVFPEAIKKLKKTKMQKDGIEEDKEEQSREILAADVRPHGIKTKDFKGYENLNPSEVKKLKKESLNILKNSEIYRIMAGILGIDYGDLRQRGRERRLKLLLGVAGIVAVSLAVFTTFMVMMYLKSKHSENIARQQTSLMILSYGNRAIENEDRISAMLIADKAMEYASSDMEQADYIKTMYYSILSRSLVNSPYTGIAKMNIGRRSPFYIMIEEGYKIVSIGENGNLEIWDVKEAKKLREIEYADHITAAAGNPSGDTVVSCSFTGELCQWDLDKGTYKTIGVLPDTKYNEMGITKDGKYLLGVLSNRDNSNRLEVWNIEKSEIIFTKDFPFENNLVFAVTSSDNRHIAYLQRDGAIEEVDIENNTITKLAEPSERTIFSKGIAYSEDGAYFYYAEGHMLHILNREDPQNPVEIDLNMQAGSIQVHKDFVYVGVQVGINKGIAIVDTKTKKIRAVLEGKDKLITNIVVNPVNGDAAAVWADDSLSIWRNIKYDTEEYNYIYKTIEGKMGNNIVKLTFSDDGKYLLYSSADGNISVIDTEGSSDYTELEGNLAGQSSDFRNILLKQDKSISVYDIQENKITHTLSLPEAFDTIYTMYSISNDATIFAASDIAVPAVILVDTKTKKEISYTESTGFSKEDFLMVTDILFNKDNTEVYVAFSNGKVIRYDVASGKEIFRYDENSLELKSVVLSKEEKYFALSLINKDCLVIDTATGKIVDKIKGEVYALTEKEDGFDAIGITNDDIFKYASEGRTEIITTNNLREGLLNRSLNTNSISSDKNYLLTMVTGGTTVLTDANNGIFIKEFGASGNYIRNAYFNQDASKIIYDAGEDSVRIEHFYSIEDLEQRKKDFLGNRMLSDQELEKIYKSK